MDTLTSPTELQPSHTEQTDAIIRKHGMELGKAVRELLAHGGSWYWKKVRNRAVVLGVISADAILLGKNGEKVCIHTEETDAIIRSHAGNIKAACAELRWGNNRAVRQRAIELGVIEDVKRKGGPPIKYVPTPETDAVLFQHPQEIQTCARLINWDKAAVRRRMVELEIIKKGRKIDTRKYKHTRKTDALIRAYMGHTRTLETILGWSQEVILERAIHLGVRKKGDRQPKEFKYVKWDSIDEVIRKYNGYAVPIAAETGWGKDAIARRVKQLNLNRYKDARTGRSFTYNKMYVPSPEVDAIIQDCYKEKYRGGGSILNAVERIKDHATATNTPRWSEGAVQGRARELGLVKGRKTSNGMKWTPEEDNLILENAHFTVPTIQGKLANAFPFSPRTQGAIQGRLTRLKASDGVETGYTMKSLCERLHVAREVVIRWLSRGELKGFKKHVELVEEQNDVASGVWHFTEDDVRSFILEHPEEVDVTLVDKLWLFDVLSNGKVGVKSSDDKIKRKNQAFYGEIKEKAQKRVYKFMRRVVPENHPWKQGL